jgi:hypothetical protein
MSTQDWLILYSVFSTFFAVYWMGMAALARGRKRNYKRQVRALLKERHLKWEVWYQEQFPNDAMFFVGCKSPLSKSRKNDP